jgi:hypothetical protein
VSTGVAQGLNQAPADLQAVIDAGQGDVPVKDLKFRCAKCGSRLTDWVVMGVQPWRSDDAESTSSAAGHLRGQRPWRQVD